MSKGLPTASKTILIIAPIVWGAVAGGDVYGAETCRQPMTWRDAVRALDQQKGLSDDARYRALVLMKPFIEMDLREYEMCMRRLQNRTLPR